MLCDSFPETGFDRQFLWIDTNPSLQCFHRRLMTLLSQEFPIKHWEYSQTPDEPSSLEMVLDLLHQYIDTVKQPLHLIGHGQGGILALNYARRYPSRVASVTLLSVAVQPIATWQRYYYQQLNDLPYNRRQVLVAVASKISKMTCPRYVHHLADRLDQDLLTAPSGNSPLGRDAILSTGPIHQPLFIGGSSDDPVMAGPLLEDWQYFLKQGDRLWLEPAGGHFFHHQQAASISEQIKNFWRQLPLQGLPCFTRLAQE